MDLFNELKYFYQHENTGHGFDHTERVYFLSLKLAAQVDIIYDKQFLAYIALLHDVDDYKLVGIESSEKLSNAKYFMDKYGICESIKERVLDEIRRLGFHNALANIRPLSIEGQIVSDADMCDSLGSHGILRTYQYNHAKGIPFFDPSVFPESNINAINYVNKKNISSINHFFEKLLRIDGMMLTEPGKSEAKKRKEIMISFLRNYFEEENAADWLNYLNDYLLNDN